MFRFTIGRVLHVSIERDFLLRVGRRELYWQRGEGFSYQRVPDRIALSA